ncbi:MAG: PaaI family thioesterase [Candidatus Rokuibacteriota bacterium]
MTEPIAPPLPDAFRDRFAGLEERRPGDESPFHRCFGCGPAHPTGLHVRCFRSGEGIVSLIVIPRQYEGPPGAAHGGIVAAYLDEVLGAAASTGAGRPAVTGELTVRYVAPVPTEAPLVGHGRVVADHGRYVDVEGRLEALTGSRVLATARGRFFPRKAG